MSESEEYWVLTARAAGLENALAEFGEDVAAAATVAANASAALLAPQDVRAEPWPPMRVSTGL